MTRKYKILAGTTAVVLLAAAGGTVIWQRYHATANAAQPQQAAPPPNTVGQVIIEGRTQAREVVTVAPPISGRLEVLHVAVGDDVYEGQLLAEVKSETLEVAEQGATLELERAQTRVNNLESSIATARLEASRASADAQRARSEFDRATRNYSRQKLLIAEGATPRQAFEKAEKEYKTLEAETANLSQSAASAEERVTALNRDLDAARKVLDNSVRDLETAKVRLAAGQILSPATGVLAGIRGAAGDEIHPEIRDLFQIATDTSVLDITFDVSPAQAAKLKPEMPVAITTADTADQALPGRITKIEGTKVTAEFANPSPLVKPGQTAQVRLELH